MEAATGPVEWQAEQTGQMGGRLSPMETATGPVERQAEQTGPLERQAESNAECNGWSND